MTFFLGTKGNIRLRRGTRDKYGAFADIIDPEDINTNLNRIGSDKSVDNLITGDRVNIETDDARGLVCFPPAAWSNGAVNNSISAYVNVNAVGGMRFFESFADAVNNNRVNEIAVATFVGDPIDVKISIRDVNYNTLGCVTSYEFNTDRQTIDASTLNDKFRQQLSSGLLSGNGRIDCAFNYSTSGTSEAPIFLLQVIQRIEIGSEFDIALYLTDKTVDPNVENIFYMATAVVTSSGVQVRAGEIIDCSINFVTTGEIRLIVGRPADFILADDDGRLQLEQSIDFLLQDEDD
jgi:hypothetical protein